MHPHVEQKCVLHEISHAAAVEDVEHLQDVQVHLHAEWTSVLYHATMCN